ncbi:hypothetical protein CC1G_10195 [Coprinopsis cinerea okayama7|uniref:Uncharacterized protein n=1 Tax=Coprinopsis cinerea (strain Okayama-7 / 130 / ATCC MYA-4618 / FGSC 9003) TaxID=240176 RepID=A8PGE5_COPC7|nr:hypothetical protein CC1G_10195 [Coprinopsis cinerea okayama7\|eukprot:XP_001841198.2 hypothetical protein CC1G_10195 [Coprinopsis cinerea okayama7\
MSRQAEWSRRLPISIPAGCVTALIADYFETLPCEVELIWLDEWTALKDLQGRVCSSRSNPIHSCLCPGKPESNSGNLLIASVGISPLRLPGKACLPIPLKDPVVLTLPFVLILVEKMTISAASLAYNILAPGRYHHLLIITLSNRLVLHVRHQAKKGPSNLDVSINVDGGNLEIIYKSRQEGQIC